MTTILLDGPDWIPPTPDPGVDYILFLDLEQATCPKFCAQIKDFAALSRVTVVVCDQFDEAADLEILLCGGHYRDLGEPVNLPPPLPGVRAGDDDQGLRKAWKHPYTPPDSGKWPPRITDGLQPAIPALAHLTPGQALEALLGTPAARVLTAGQPWYTEFAKIRKKHPKMHPVSRLVLPLGWRTGTAKGCVTTARRIFEKLGGPSATRPVGVSWPGPVPIKLDKLADETEVVAVLVIPRMLQVTPDGRRFDWVLLETHCSKVMERAMAEQGCVKGSKEGLERKLIAAYFPPRGKSQPIQEGVAVLGRIESHAPATVAFRTKRLCFESYPSRGSASHPRKNGYPMKAVEALANKVYSHRYGVQAAPGLQVHGLSDDHIPQAWKDARNWSVEENLWLCVFWNWSLWQPSAAADVFVYQPGQLVTSGNGKNLIVEANGIPPIPFVLHELGTGRRGPLSTVWGVSVPVPMAEGHGPAHHPGGRPGDLEVEDCLHPLVYFLKPRIPEPEPS